jgi:hypothetical protein
MLYDKLTAFFVALFMLISAGGGENFTLRDAVKKQFILPVIDGSEASRVLSAAFVAGFLEIDYDTVLKNTVHNDTEKAFDRLISGEVDIVIDTYSYPLYDDKYRENDFEYAVETVATRTFDVVDPRYDEYTDFEYQRVYYNKNTDKQYVIDFIAYMLSDEGQASVYLCGFEPIKDVTLPLEKKPHYETLGTGEKRPTNFGKSTEYSNITFAYGSYGAPDHKDMRLYLLDGDLTDTALEAKINEWIETEITEKNLIEKYPYIGVYCTGINGYLEVVITIAYFEDDNYMPDSPVSVWNLKTGERVTRLSDLFYEGTDFIPALEKAYDQSFYSPFINLETEPKRFFITDFLVGDLAYDYIQNAFNNESEEERYKKPINSLTDIMDLTPIWTFYDMSPHFTNDHLDKNNGWGLLYTNTIPEYSLSPKHFEKMCEWRIYSSRFLSEAEIKARNIMLNKIYAYIENTTEFSDYQKDYDDRYSLINTNVNFSDDGKCVLVKTTFGSYFMNEDDAKIITQEDDIKLSNDEVFLGIIDIDFDGIPEWISENKGLNIYDDELNLIKSIPIAGYSDLFEWQKWQITKDIETGKIGGVIYFYNSMIYYAVNYEIENKEFKIIEINEYELETKRETEENTNTSLKNRQSVTYTMPALDTNPIDMFSGEAENSFGKFVEEINKHNQKAFAAVVFDDYNTAFFTKNSVTYNDTKISEEDFSGSDLSVLSDDDVQILTVKPNEKNKPVWIWEYNDGELIKSQISQKAYSFNYTTGAKYNFSADFIANDIYKIGDDDSLTDVLETKLKYWFYINHGRMTEYGGVNIPIERFSKFADGHFVLSAIEREGGSITGIIYRENDIVNINYDVKNANITHHYYRTYYYDYHNIYDIPKLIFIERGAGVYLPSITESIGIDGMNKPSYGMSIPTK